jgi:hypothetical protein
MDDPLDYAPPQSPKRNKKESWFVRFVLAIMAIPILIGVCAITVLTLIGRASPGLLAILPICTGALIVTGIVVWRGRLF